MTQTKVEDYSVFELLLSPTIALTYFKQECYPTSCFRVFTCYQGKKPAKLLPGLQCTISTSTNIYLGPISAAFCLVCRSTSFARQRWHPGKGSIPLKRERPSLISNAAIRPTKCSLATCLFTGCASCLPATKWSCVDNFT